MICEVWSDCWFSQLSDAGSWTEETVGGESVILQKYFDEKEIKNKDIWVKYIRDSIRFEKEFPLKYIEVSNWCIRQSLELNSLGKLKFVSPPYQPSLDSFPNLNIPKKSQKKSFKI